MKGTYNEASVSGAVTTLQASVTGAAGKFGTNNVGNNSASYVGTAGPTVFAAPTVGGAGTVLALNVGTTVTNIAVAATDTLATVVGNINLKTADTGVTASVDAATGALKLTGTQAFTIDSTTDVDAELGLAKGGAAQLTQTANINLRDGQFAGTAGNLKLGTTSVAVAVGDTLSTVITNINKETGTTGVTASIDSASGQLKLSSAAGFAVDDDQTGALLSGLGMTAKSVVIAPQVTGLAKDTDIQINGQGFSLSAGIDLDTIVKTINDNGGATGAGTALTGVTAKNDNGRLVLTSAAGQDIKLENGTDSVKGAGALERLGLNAGTNKAGLQADTSVTLNGVEVKFKKGADMDSIAATINAASTGVSASKTTVAGKSSLELFADKNITIGDGSSGTGLAALGLGAGGTTAAVTMESTVSNLDILDAASAQQAIQVLDGAMQELDSQRSQLGAVQNRFDSTVANLQSISENSTAARSRVQDADFASETAELSKQQTLQQASTAILSQANQLSSSVLKLLQ
jgi:flagellin